MLDQQTADKIKDYGNDLVDKGGEGWSAFYALADYIDTLVSEDTPEQIKRRRFQEVAYSPDIEFVLLRRQIAKRMIEEYKNSLVGEGFRGSITNIRNVCGRIIRWLNKESER